MNHPTVLLLDEPLGALDQQLRQEMQRELKRIQQQVGITFVCVTHDQEEALFMSDRIAVLHQGKIMQVGTPQDLYNQPGSLFVAEFVGLSNRLVGEVSGSGNRDALFQSPGITSFQVFGPSSNGSEQPATFVIRPERIRLRPPNDPCDVQNALSATVLSSLYLGDEMQYQVLLAAGITWIIREPIVSHEHTRFSSGDPVLVCWDSREGVLLYES